MMFLLAALINLMMQTEFFGSASNIVPVKGKKMTGKDWLLYIIWRVVVPAIIFVPLSAYVIKGTGKGTTWSYFITSANLNGIMGWLLAIMVINIVRLVMRNNKRKANGELSLADVGLGAEGEHGMQWSRMWKSILMGLIILILIYS